MHLQDDSAFCLRTRERRVKTVNFDKNRPKLIGYTWTTQNLFPVYNRIYTSTKTETLVKTGSVVVDIFGDIRQFQPSRSTIFIFYPTLTQKLLNRFSPFLHDVEQLVKLLMHASARR